MPYYVLSIVLGAEDKAMSKTKHGSPYHGGSRVAHWWNRMGNQTLMVQYEQC